MFDSKLNLHCYSQIDYFRFQFKFNNHKIVQYENKNLPYTNVSMPIILFMLTTNVLEEHCHHIQDCIFFPHFFSQTNKNRTRTDNES